jgi:hypothetical protein
MEILKMKNMTERELTKIAIEYMQIWNVGNESVLDRYADRNLTVDYTHFNKPYRGISDYKLLLKMTYDYFPDLEITLDKIIVNEKRNSVT